MRIALLLLAALLCFSRPAFADDINAAQDVIR